MKFRYVAISDGWKEAYSTKKQMLSDLKNWGSEATIYCYTYTYVGEGNDSDLTSEDIIYIRKGKVR